MYQPTSLNLVVRKKETERIERENHAFAKRLFDKRAVVEKKNLEKDYMAHLKYKRQIQKIPANMRQKQRANTRGHPSAAGMSAAQLGISEEGFPQPPSHYLGQAPQALTASEGQMMQPTAGMHVSASADNDSLSLAQQPAAT